MNTTTTGLLGLVTTEEAARLLGVTASAIRQRIRRNRIHALYVGGVLLVSLADLRRYGRPASATASAAEAGDLMAGDLKEEAATC